MFKTTCALTWPEKNYTQFRTGLNDYKVSRIGFTGEERPITRNTRNRAGCEAKRSLKTIKEGLKAETEDNKKGLNKVMTLFIRETLPLEVTLSQSGSVLANKYIM